ncbi:LOW QUALITY PROTEIN: fas-binding factor 1 homolog [Puntigrus tetrazona]|uniref:LOW QUALITY PROTEIN: fas-binding factor 1 homolog n=1 Tax=Puntigrus tetrazona TaxID=1606681 RepID=UPI001C8A827F|nr:LOW QUALITY PROTEIN: fas-binding factor 1 homolog [Puntigrus tetrazona]
MTSKQKKGLRSSIDDVLGDLLGDGEDEGPVKPRSPAALSSRPTAVLASRGGKRSLLDDDFFSKLAEEAEKDDEGSDVSEADPAALLDSMKDMDDMDADLFSSKKKPSSAPAQKNEPKRAETAKADAAPEEKKPSSAPAAAARTYKKFSFLDDEGGGLGPPLAGEDKGDEPLDDLLDDLEPKQKTAKKTEPPSSSSPASPQKTAAVKKRDDLTFDDDEDDLMDALGFGETRKTQESGKAPKKDGDPPQRARTRLDEILGRGTSPRLLERPVTGEKKDAPQPEKQTEKSAAGKASLVDDEDFAFGSYQPTVGSTPEGRQSRRQSVRFSTEDVSVHSPEHKPKPSARAARPRSDWLGLKQDEEELKMKEEPRQSASETLKPPASPSTAARKETPASPKTTSKPVKRDEDEEDDWLAGALSRKKTQSVSQSEDRKQEASSGLGEEVDAFVSSKSNVPSVPRRRQEESPVPNTEPSRESTGVYIQSTASSEAQHKPGLNQTLSSQSREPKPRPFNSSSSTQPKPHAQDPRAPSGRDVQTETLPSSPSQGWRVPALAPPAVWMFPQKSPAEGAVPVTQTHTPLSADSLQQLLIQQQLAQSQLWGLSGSLDSQRLRDTDHQHDVTSLQKRIIQLEGQVRSLQLERDQNQMLLESVQQRHRQDTELMENMHRARVKLLEESSAQRELRSRQENEDLAERLAAVARLAEQERAEMQAQQQRRLTQCQQDRDREVERLRDLQRKSILEMKRDHEEQIQRLKKLKDEEIDAVTSATSQTRSLTVVIEQMEQFSRRLGDLSSRVESSHENTAQGLEVGARQRDEQLRGTDTNTDTSRSAQSGSEPVLLSVLQERLSQQQREMAEERSRLKEVIAKMDTQLAEQQRQLEKERWRVTSEQAKAESSLRGLEEERRTMMQQFSMERDELERAKSALLEEQQSVMQHCAEERRKLAAEWSRFHTQEKVRQERVEREASRAMERDAHREGSIFSMAQEQADLKLRAGELKQKEEALQRDRDGLEKLRQELDAEKERLSTAALRLKTRAQEVEGFSKLASERFEEGERALREARQVEAEHQTRLRNIHTQMERLRQQEHNLQQERLRRTDHHRDTERLRHTPPVHPAPLITDFSPALASTHLTAAVTPLPPELHARLALIKHTAEKDRDFLQEEQYFLDTLKKTSYNSAVNT